MQHEKWFFNGRIQQHLIEIKHYPNTGYVGVFLNENPLYEKIISENQSQNFYFFVDEELCEVRATCLPPNHKYMYELIAHPTPTADANKKAYQKDLFQKIGFAFATFFIFGALIVFLWLPNFLHQKSLQNIEKGGFVTQAQIIYAGAYLSKNYDNKNLIKGTIHYQFIDSKNKKYYGGIVTPVQNEKIYLPSSFPITAGDIFEVLYAPKNPIVSTLQLKNLTPHQADYYQMLARTVCTIDTAFTPPKTVQSKMGFCQCLVEKAYTEHQQKGIGTLYQFFMENVSEKSTLNADTQYIFNNPKKYMEAIMQNLDTTCLKKNNKNC